MALGHEPTIIKTFREYQSRIKEIGLFLEVYRSKFAIGHKKHRAGFSKVINRSYTNNTECPIHFVGTLEEVEGFIRGFAFAKNKVCPI